MSNKGTQIERVQDSQEEKYDSKSQTLTKKQIDSLFRSVGNPMVGYGNSNRTSNESSKSRTSALSEKSYDSNVKSAEERITYDYVLKALKKQEEFREKYNKLEKLKEDGINSPNSTLKKRTNSGASSEEIKSNLKNSRNGNLKSIDLVNDSSLFLSPSRYSNNDTISIKQKISPNFSKINLTEINRNEIESVYESSRKSVERRRKSRDRNAIISILNNDSQNIFDGGSENYSDYMLKKTYPELNFIKDGSIPPRVFEKEYKHSYIPASVSRKNSGSINSGVGEKENSLMSRLSYESDAPDKYPKNFNKDRKDHVFSDDLLSNADSQENNKKLEFTSNYPGSLLEKIKDSEGLDVFTTNEKISNTVSHDDDYSESEDAGYRSINGSYVRYAPESFEGYSSASEKKNNTKYYQNSLKNLLFERKNSSNQTKNTSGDVAIKEWEKDKDEENRYNNSVSNKDSILSPPRRNMGKITSITPPDSDFKNKPQKYDDSDQKLESSYPIFTNSSSNRNNSKPPEPLPLSEIHYPQKPKLTKLRSIILDKPEEISSTSDKVADFIETNFDLDKYPKNENLISDSKELNKPDVLLEEYQKNESQVPLNMHSIPIPESNITPVRLGRMSARGSKMVTDGNFDNLSQNNHSIQSQKLIPALKSSSDLVQTTKYTVEKQTKKNRHRNVGIQCNIYGKIVEKDKEKLSSEILKKDLLIEELNKKLDSVESSHLAEVEQLNKEIKKCIESKGQVDEELEIVLSQLKNVNLYVETLEKSDKGRVMEIEKLNKDLIEYKKVFKDKTDELLDQIAYLSSQVEYFRNKELMAPCPDDDLNLLSNIYKDSIKVVKSFSGSIEDVDYIEKQYEIFKNENFTSRDNSEFIKTISKIESSLETSNLAISKGLETISKNINSLDLHINNESIKNKNENKFNSSNSISSFKSKIENSLSSSQRRITSFSSTPTKLSVPPKNNCDTLDLRLGKRNFNARPPIPKAFSQRPKRGSTGLSMILKQGSSLLKKDIVDVNVTPKIPEEDKTLDTPPINGDEIPLSQYSSPSSTQDTLNDMEFSSDSISSGDNNFSETQESLKPDSETCDKYGSSVSFIPKNSTLNEEFLNRSSIFFFVKDSLDSNSLKNFNAEYLSMNSRTPSRTDNVNNGSIDQSLISESDSAELKKRIKVNSSLSISKSELPNVLYQVEKNQNSLNKSDRQNDQIGIAEKLKKNDESKNSHFYKDNNADQKNHLSESIDNVSRFRIGSRISQGMYSI
ncbi:hypothetical protein AYI68_g6789 [Smittium mucronatum]|uniref:Uncharacterized protein n=1 Tax=Smittium mucronatum TaxID=133383 RepID=A0A1R0GQK4_9FUNG|nr:hypothetical protein AYI68_g6789 [Smittium mucronatum]